jgi:SEC-C motif domain protein
MEKCPCNSNKYYSDCCYPFLEEEQQADTSEKLMRSRYTAHVKNKIDYIVNTYHPDSRKNTKRSTIEQWASKTSWKGLEIINVSAGGKNAQMGRVEFKAHYKIDNKLKFHHEDSLFQKLDGQWYYVDGITPKTQPKRSFKTGRNAPCHCGSNKKFKKCCGKNS